MRAEEQLAFSDWINTNLGGDQHLDHILPLHHTGAGLYDAVKDGAVPGGSSIYYLLSSNDTSKAFLIGALFVRDFTVQDRESFVS